MFYDSERGFGLIQAVVATAIVATVGLGMATMMVAQSQQVSYAEDRLSKMHLEREIEDYIQQDEKNCGRTLINAKVKRRGKTRIPLIAKDRFEGKHTLLHLDSRKRNRNTYDRLKIKDIYIEDISVHDNGGTEGDVRLVIAPERVRSGGGTKKLNPIEKVISVNVDNKTKKITSCHTRSLAGGFQCAVPDSKQRMRRTLQTGNNSFTIPKDTAAVTLILSDGIPKMGTRCDDDYSCPEEPVIQYTIYPGETQIGRTKFKERAKLTVKRIYLGTKTTYSCSKKQRNKQELYRNEYYYDGIKLASKEDTYSKYGIHCPVYKSYRPALNNTTLPIMCPIKSPSSSTAPDNIFGIYLYEDDD